FERRRGRFYLASSFVIFGLSFGVSAHRVSQRYFNHAALVHDFSEVRAVLSKRNPARATPLLIYLDPLDSPGGFFLQQEGPLCYVSGREMGSCDQRYSSALVLCPRGND